MVEVRSFIDGQFVNPNIDAWFERKSPVTGEVSTRVPDSDLLDLVGAVQAANKAWALFQKQERELRLSESAEICEKIAVAIDGSSEEIARLQSEETGLPIRASRMAVERAVAEFRYFATLVTERDNAASVTGSVTGAASGSTTGSVTARANRLPIGVVSLILPAYDPVLSLARRLAPALAAGNVVIAKASSSAPRTGARLTEVINSAGLSPGVFNLLQGRGERIGQAIVQHPGLSTISFAGKTETGRLIQQGAAELLKRTQLSMSGCSSILIFDGVDLDETARAVVELSLSGATPLHLRGARIFVQDPIYGKFLESLARAAATIKIGDPLQEATTLGPLVRSEEKRRFEQAVAQAVKERGKLLDTGLKIPADGNFVVPTIIYDVSLCSTLQQEEVPGPLAMVESFKYQHDGIKLVNNSPFGQIAYVFHADPLKAAKVAGRLEAGRVVVNSPSAPNSPGASFGALKASGFGREGGVESLDFFSRRTLMI